MATIITHSKHFVMTIDMAKYRDESRALPLVKLVPSSARRYDPATHEWTFSDMVYLPVVIAAFVNTDNAVRVLDDTWGKVEVYDKANPKGGAGDQGTPAAPPRIPTLRGVLRVEYMGLFHRYKTRSIAHLMDKGKAFATLSFEAHVAWFARFVRDAEEEQNNAWLKIDLDNPFAALGFKIDLLNLDSALSLTDAQVKAAWRARMLMVHPDHCKAENAQEGTMAIQAAYKRIGTERGRKIYVATQRRLGRHIPSERVLSVCVGEDKPKINVGDYTSLRTFNLDCDYCYLPEGGLDVIKIHEIRPIKNAAGQTLTAIPLEFSADRYKTEWR